MDRTFFEIREALAQPGCFLCRLEEKYAERFLDGLFYEFVNDPGVRQKILAGGFCKDHARTLFTLRPSILGMTIVYRSLLENYLSGNELDPSLCPVCQNWEKRYAHIEHVLHTHWEELQDSWGGETFLCLRHLKNFPEPFRSKLEDLTRIALKNIHAALSKLVEKFDYHNISLPITPEEARSWQEAMEFFAGNTFQQRRD